MLIQFEGRGNSKKLFLFIAMLIELRHRQSAKGDRIIIVVIALYACACVFFTEKPYTPFGMKRVAEKINSQMTDRQCVSFLF